MSDAIRSSRHVEQDEPKAIEELIPIVYEELRKLAALKMSGQPPGHTLQPTALVHEAYLRLAGSRHREWQGRRHFFAAAAEAMRHILIDAARKKSRIKRGAGWQRLDLEAVQLAVDSQPEDLLAVDEALEVFTREYPEEAALVKMRFYAGLSLAQAARALGLSLAATKRSWTFSRAWLCHRLGATVGA